MKRFLAVVLASAILCGSSYGIGVTNWIGANGASWDTASNWDNGVPTASLKAVIQIGRYPAGTGAKTVGEIYVDNASYFNLGSPSTLNVSSSNGGSGNFVWAKNAYYKPSGSIPWTFNVDGNFIQKSTGFFSEWAAAGSKIYLKGGNGLTNAYFVNDGVRPECPWDVIVQGTYYDNGSAAGGCYGGGTSSYNGYSSAGYGTGTPTPPRWYLCTVTSTGKIAARPDGVQSIWTYTGFDFQGGQSNLPALLAPVDFGYVYGRTDNGTKRPAISGGVTYPRDLYLYGPRGNVAPLAGKPYVYRVKQGTGAFTVGRDMYMACGGDYATYENWFYSQDNSTGASVNFTVNRDLSVGTGQWDTTALNFGMELFGSNVRVGRDLLVGRLVMGGPRNGTMKLDCATIRLGENFTVGAALTGNPTAWMVSNWSGGTSTVICDGNGTAYHQAQTLTMWGECGITLNNLIVNNFGGSVSLYNGLGGALRLTGDLRIDNGTFTGYKRPIIFAGNSRLTNNVSSGTYKFDDNINILTGATVTLGSDITLNSSGSNIDNLIMTSGASLYLNGFTFKANSQTWASAGVSASGVAYESGTIYGTLSVPEPATLLLVSGALGAMGWMRRRRIR